MDAKIMEVLERSNTQLRRY